ncbi:helix-turn-helix domain-containing protein [Kribbella qitaiheensis]|uniref:citrate synthase (unknown stereospecificity) n=1 Tax=Kribbella qitaiheensis TaxID=1544730 RepID=A0A7G6WUR6_9ACTN|nr:citrate/2-methylcitrate synthase [Kribbella qitaiheensis]QNE17731.1 helix-turn-helix domain-containing protein [Kribbella qitaiheensis]
MTQQRDENYLTTAEVARRLNVKPETIYAYVSRGQLTSVRARGQRSSLFAAADVERLASRSVEHTGVVERIETELSLLQDDELYYRGRPARELATTSTVESVAHLLWTGELAEQDPFPAPPAQVELASAAMAVAPPTARMTDQLRIAVAVLGAGDPLRFDLAPESVVAAASRLLGVLVDALPGETTQGTLGTRLWPKLTTQASHPKPASLDAVLILLADHGLAVSTIAARVAASARANLYSVVSAGLGALDGHYHGAATTLAYKFLDRALQDPVEALSDQLRSGEPVPGFGHRIYQQRDPRAEALFELLANEPVEATVRELIDKVPAFPNSDLAIAAMMHAYGFRPDAGEALFAIARIIGWTAHALEEYAEPGLRFRTAGIYTGPPVD